MVMVLGIELWMWIECCFRLMSYLEGRWYGSKARVAVESSLRRSWNRSLRLQCSSGGVWVIVVPVLMMATREASKFPSESLRKCWSVCELAR